jgi:hypothetical protein
MSQQVEKIVSYLCNNPSSFSPAFDAPRTEARHCSKKVLYLQNYKHDNTTAIDVLTTLLFTSKPTAELALAVPVFHNAFESKDIEPCYSRAINKSTKKLICSANYLSIAILISLSRWPQMVL